MFRKKIKLYDWNIYDYLKTERDIDGFLEAAYEEAKDDADSAYINHALGVAARARGMMKVSKDTNLDRSNLYKSFSMDGDPRVSTLDKVARSFGYRLTLARIGA